MAIARRRMTLEQFLALDEQEPALEYVDGVVTQKLSPKFRHGLVQGLRDLIDRCRWYVGNGVRVALLVHPSRRSVHVFRPDGETGPLHGAEQVELRDVIPGFSFTVDDLFSALRPR